MHVHPDAPSRPVALPSGRSGAVVARFFEARGYAVVDAGGALWAETGSGFFQSLPLEGELDPELDDVRRALRSERGIGALYPTRTRSGRLGGMFAAFPARYSLASVDRNHRRQVRKGLERSEIRSVDADELYALGFVLNLETMERQRRFDPEFGERARWRRFCLAVRDSPGVAATGAFVAGRLSSYWISVRDHGWLHLMFKFARTDHLIHRSAVALDFRMVADAATDPAIVGVSNSYAAIVPRLVPLDRYKLAMGFELVPHRRALEFHPALHGILTNRLAIAAARIVSRARPESDRLRMLAELMDGMRSSGELDGDRTAA